ncbi:MAG: helix-turn-helix domain-containing protein, partial [Chloroflexia bacterium]
MNEDKGRLISLAEAAKIFGFNRDYRCQLARKGRLKARKVGRDWVTIPADVEAYIASRQRRGVYRDDRAASKSCSKPHSTHSQFG